MCDSRYSKRISLCVAPLNSVQNLGDHFSVFHPRGAVVGDQTEPKVELCFSEFRFFGDYSTGSVDSPPTTVAIKNTSEVKKQMLQNFLPIAPNNHQCGIISTKYFFFKNGEWFQGIWDKIPQQINLSLHFFFQMYRNLKKRRRAWRKLTINWRRRRREKNIFWIVKRK